MRAAEPPLLTAVRRRAVVRPKSSASVANRDHCAGDGQRGCRRRAGAAAGIGRHRCPGGGHPAALPRSAGRLAAVRLRRVPAVLLSRSAGHQLRQRRRADGLAAPRRAPRHHAWRSRTPRPPGPPRDCSPPIRVVPVRTASTSPASRRSTSRGCSPTTTCSASTPAASAAARTSAASPPRRSSPAWWTSRTRGPATRRPMPPSSPVRSSSAKPAPAPSSAGSSTPSRPCTTWIPPPLSGPGQAGLRQAQLPRLLLRHLAGGLVRRHLPDHTGRFILDSNMNWTASMYANQLTDSFSFQRRRDLMFYPWVARRNKTYRLGDTAAKVRRSYEKIRTKLLKSYRRGDYVYSVAEADDLIAGQLFANWQFPEAGDTLLDLKSVSSVSTADRAALRRLDATAKRIARLGAGSAADLARRGGRPPRPRTTSRSRSAATRPSFAATTPRTRVTSPRSSNGPTRTPPSIASSATATRCRCARTGSSRP